MGNMNKVIDKVIDQNLEDIEEGKLKEYRVDVNTILEFKTTCEGIRTTVIRGK